MVKSVIAVGITASILTILNTGCSTCDTKRATNLSVVDPLPSSTQKGYVEFYTLANNYPVPVYYVDEHGKEFFLGSVGLKPGARYSQARNGTTAQKLRVALPAGNPRFMIERNGQQIQVPVTVGQLTPVELDYVPFDYAASAVVYRLDARIFSPGAYKETPAGTDNNAPAPKPMARR